MYTFGLLTRIRQARGQSGQSTAPILPQELVRNVSASPMANTEDPTGFRRARSADGMSRPAPGRDITPVSNSDQPARNLTIAEATVPSPPQDPEKRSRFGISWQPDKRRPETAVRGGPRQASVPADEHPGSPSPSWVTWIPSSVNRFHTLIYGDSPLRAERCPGGGPASSRQSGTE